MATHPHTHTLSIYSILVGASEWATNRKEETTVKRIQKPERLQSSAMIIYSMQTFISSAMTTTTAKNNSHYHYAYTCARHFIVDFKCKWAYSADESDSWVYDLTGNENKPSFLRFCTSPLTHIYSFFKSVPIADRCVVHRQYSKVNWHFHRNQTKSIFSKAFSTGTVRSNILDNRSRHTAVHCARVKLNPK